ncbi:MAG TPA: pyruvate kinase [Thermodesulfobium narugense]|nr:MAG: pyruvate kinase [Thermodesulfobium narugense]HEM55760.1 pyruvate kinase [Thermodesulfobium narugense]
MIRKTKIICTLGPSTDDPEILYNFVKNGMDVARLNFSHGDYEDHFRRIQMVREASKELKREVALMLDTKGPEIRVGKFKSGSVQLKKGQKFILTAEEIEGNEEIVSVTYPDLIKKIKRGNVIVLSDGLISLQVEDTDDKNIYTTVMNNGILKDHKRVAVPGVFLDMQFLSEKDINDIKFGIENEMDFIAASFVQNASNILEIRRVLEENNSNMDIIAKIENRFGIDNIDEILKVADGIMVARGDMGIDIPNEDVPLIQKELIKKANKIGKPVITATQMLESMINNPHPTRAEASDVANAILDGTDAVMLSGETAAGNYPLEAMEMMARIALKTEMSLDYKVIFLSKGLNQKTTTDAISHATVQISHELDAAAIVSITQSGYTAKMVSKYRPNAFIIGVSPDIRMVRKMKLIWGVYPIKCERTNNTEEMVLEAISKSTASNLIKEGDLVVITAGVPLGATGTTNMIRVHLVGNIILKGIGVGRGSYTGTVCIANTLKDFRERMKAGCIVVAKSIDEELAKYTTEAGALIVEEGGLTSNAVILGINFGIPVVIGVEGAVELLKDGLVITVDAEKGLIYQGEINVR